MKTMETRKMMNIQVINIRNSEYTDFEWLNIKQFGVNEYIVEILK